MRVKNKYKVGSFTLSSLPTTSFSSVVFAKAISSTKLCAICIISNNGMGLVTWPDPKCDIIGVDNIWLTG